MVYITYTLFALIFIYTHDLTALKRYTNIGEGIRRVGKYHIELDVKLL